MMQLNNVFVKINYCSIFFYDIMAKSPSGQDEANCVFWLATPLPIWDFPHWSREKKYSFYNFLAIQKILYWPSLFGQYSRILASFFSAFFIDFDFISVNKNAQENLANIELSWPHDWSIMHIHLIMAVYLNSDIKMNYYQL